MTPTEFATFKYQHADKVSRSKQRIVFALVSLVVAVAVIGLTGSPVGAFLLVVPAIAWFSVPRQLLLGPRYLLCGNAIVYFGNVKRMTLTRSQGKLRLECTNGKAFVLERDKFPTGARKKDKIAKNKAKKFDKVSGKIMDKVRAASANVVMMGA
jgi:hypothetical protein